MRYRNCVADPGSYVYCEDPPADCVQMWLEECKDYLTCGDRDLAVANCAVMEPVCMDTSTRGCAPYGTCVFDPRQHMCEEAPEGCIDTCRKHIMWFECMEDPCKSR